jgi:hypothetical protein
VNGHVNTARRSLDGYNASGQCGFRVLPRLRWSDHLKRRLGVVREHDNGGFTTRTEGPVSELEQAHAALLRALRAGRPGTALLLRSRAYASVKHFLAKTPLSHLRPIPQLEPAPLPLVGVHPAPRRGAAQPTPRCADVRGRRCDPIGGPRLAPSHGARRLTNRLTADRAGARQSVHRGGGTERRALGSLARPITRLEPEAPSASALASVSAAQPPPR